MTAGDVRSAFDGITYTKGSAVLTMLEGYLGSDVFAAQIGEYLQALTHGHATADDLINSLSKLILGPVRPSHPLFSNRAYLCSK